MMMVKPTLPAECHPQAFTCPSHEDDVEDDDHDGDGDDDGEARTSSRLSSTNM